MSLSSRSALLSLFLSLAIPEKEREEEEKYPLPIDICRFPLVRRWISKPIGYLFSHPTELGRVKQQDTRCDQAT